MMRPTVLLLMSCGDPTIKLDSGVPDTRDSEFPPVETATETETPTESESATETATEPPYQCPETVPPDGVVATEAACGISAAPLTVNLVEVWSTPIDGDGFAVLTGRLADGDGDGDVDGDDPLQIAAATYEQRTQVYALDAWEADGTAIGRISGGTTGGWSIGDVEASSSGSEFVGLGGDDTGYFLDVLDESGLLRETAIADRRLGMPWLTDLEGDGSNEVLLGAWIFDAVTGAAIGELSGMNTSTLAVSADLDRDGTEEIIGGNQERGPSAVLFTADGAVIAECAGATVGGGSVIFAIGNLDDDPDGEFVAVEPDTILVCDADGTVLFEDVRERNQAGNVAIGELDGDAAAEIVFADQYGLTALNHDLTLLFDFTDIEIWSPFSLADLNGDGIHEIVTFTRDALHVIDATGVVLDSLPVDAEVTTWNNSPIVSDPDGDGLAGILWAGPSLYLVADESGGWPIASAADAWPTAGHTPGDLAADGTIPAPDSPWRRPGGNVWHGLPAGALAVPDLGIAVTEVCVEACDGDAVVTVTLWNAGAQHLLTDATITLASASGSLIATHAVTDGLPMGVSRSWVLTVPATSLTGGITAFVESPEAEECGLVSNSALWVEEPCP